MQNCPKCKKALPSSYSGGECPACGVVFSKYFAAETKRQEAEAVRSATHVNSAPASSAPSKTTSCPACGGLVAIGAKSCPHCGQTNPAPPPKKKAGPLAYALGGLFLVVFIMSAANNPSGGGGGPSPSVTDDQRTAAQVSIKLAGYHCDSISYMGRLAFKVGFRVTCNENRYAYEIVDEGGRWVVRLD